jgi:hypothetical protein
MSKDSTSAQLCPRCREPIDDKTLVCPHCGKSVAECNYHQTAAVAICSKCGMYLCKECCKEYEGGTLCSKCYASIVNHVIEQVPEDSDEPSSSKTGGLVIRYLNNLSTRKSLIAGILIIIGGLVIVFIALVLFVAGGFALMPDPESSGGGAAVSFIFSALAFAWGILTIIGGVMAMKRRK